MEPQSGQSDFIKKCESIMELAKQSNVPLQKRVVRQLAESPHEPDSLEIREALEQFHRYAKLLDAELTVELTAGFFYVEPWFQDRFGNTKNSERSMKVDCQVRDMEEKALTIDELSVFFLKYQEFIEEQKEHKKIKNDFNVITALLSQSDEVRLHSRFIFSLINPRGKHYKGTLFLKEFLDIIGVVKFNYETAEVKKEFENIDLYITDGCQHIIVENKIHAYDQNHQISRYINTIKESSDDEAIHDSIIVVYLTLDYKKPSASSLNEWRIEDNHLRHNKNIEHKIKYKNITYKTEIINWINGLSKELNEIPANVRYAIESYKEVVERITHLKGSNVMSVNEYLLLSENFDKLLITANLVNSFKAIRGKILRQFFINIDKAIDCKQFAEKYIEEEIRPFGYDYRDDYCNKWFVGRPRNYNIGTFFKTTNNPVVFGVLASQECLYFVVRAINDNESILNRLKDENIITDKYSNWELKKPNKKTEAKLRFYCLSLDLNIYAQIHTPSVLKKLCEKTFSEELAIRCLSFASSLNNLHFTE